MRVFSFPQNAVISVFMGKHTCQQAFLLPSVLLLLLPSGGRLINGTLKAMKTEWGENQDSVDWFTYRLRKITIQEAVLLKSVLLNHSKALVTFQGVEKKVVNDAPEETKADRGQIMIIWVAGYRLRTSSRVAITKKHTCQEPFLLKNVLLNHSKAYLFLNRRLRGVVDGELRRESQYRVYCILVLEFMKNYINQEPHQQTSSLVLLFHLLWNAFTTHRIRYFEIEKKMYVTTLINISDGVLPLFKSFRHRYLVNFAKFTRFVYWHRNSNKSST